MPTRAMVECLLVRDRTAKLLYLLLGVITGGSPGTTFAATRLPAVLLTSIALYNVNAPDYISVF